MFEQAFKNRDDVLWKEAGCTTELDYTEQTWSALKMVYLAIHEASRRWTMPIVGWKAALNHFAILFENRMPNNSHN